jgi:SWI/SNF-related matrix-associated actin-dependent regulator 1 of chromatin subfamily A
VFGRKWGTKIKKARLTETNKIILKFGGNDFKKILNKIKSLPSKDTRFIPVTSEWEIAYKDEYVQMLHDLNFELAPEIYTKWKDTQVDDGWKDITIPEEYDFLFPYQKDAMKYSIYHGNRIILSLDVGLGKTATSLAIMDNANLFPTLIVCPSILKGQWAREYEKFINKKDKIKIIDSSSDLINYNDAYDIYICNYELLARNIEKIGKKNTTFLPNQKLKDFYNNLFGTIILDEIHKIKNMESKTKNAIGYLCEGVSNIVGLTGTPIVNSSKDLFPMVNILKKEIFPKYYSFLNRYCNSRINYKAGGVKEFYGSRNSSELHDVLKKNVMFRLTKDEVGKGDRQKPIQTVLPIPLKNYKEYRKLEKELRESEDNKSGLEIINTMREESWNQKKDNVFEFIDNTLEDTEEKIVIFAVNKVVVEDLMQKYGKIAVKIDGSVSTKNGIRDGIVKRFVEDKKVKLFIGSIYAAGTGLNSLQTVSSIMMFLQWSWVPSEIWQCIGRLDRHGQNKIVNVFHLPGEDTVEEMFMRILDKKADMFKEIVDGDYLREEDMLQLMLEGARNGEAKLS